MKNPSREVQYVVQEGDTLMSIARMIMGKSSAWAQLRRLSRQRSISPNLVFPGEVVEAPYTLWDYEYYETPTLKLK